MSVRGQAFAGDTATFAIRLTFESDNSAIETAADLAASWGSFELWANGVNLCAHTEDGETLLAVHWYLLPLLEWLVGNWDPLLHEERLPVRNGGATALESLYATRFPAVALDAAAADRHEDDWSAWWGRHALQAARDGGLFPDVVLRRREDRLEVSWSDRAPVGVPKDFAFLAHHGSALLDPRQVAVALHDVITQAVGLLAAWSPDSERIATLRAAAGSLVEPLRRDDRVGWLFSLGRDGRQSSWDRVRAAFASTTDVIRDAIVEPDGDALVLSGASSAVLLFGSASPELDEADVATLADLLIDLYDPAGDPEPLTALTSEVDAPLTGLPWEQGAELAARTVDALALTDRLPVDIEGLLADRCVGIRDQRLSDAQVRGIAIAGPAHRPTVLWNPDSPRNAHETGRRFTLAHELCHLLVDRAAGARLAVASGPWAPVEIEQRANAFAAYLLMPPDAVRTVMAGPSERLTPETAVARVAEWFGVSRRATLEHLYNLGYLDELQRDLLRDASPGGVHHS